MDSTSDLRRRLALLGDPITVLEGIFRLAPVGLQVFDASGRSVLVNRAFVSLLGGEPPAAYNVLQDEIARESGVIDLVHRAFAGETISIPPVWYDTAQLPHIGPSRGRRVAFAATFFPLRDKEGGVRHVVVALEDVTTGLMAREQAESERDLLRAIVEQSGDGVIVCDEAGVIRILNPGAQRQHGVLPRAVPSEEWSRRFGLHAMDGRPLPLEETPLYRALRGERVEDARWIVRRPDGTERILTGTASPLRRADGNSAGAVLTTRDETERLLLEARLRDESQRTQELYRQAEELHRVKDEFLATVSHELRTPLQAILGWSRIVREEPDNRAQVERGLGIIERNARLQARLTDDILDVSRMITGKMRLEWATVDLALMVRTAVESIGPAASTKGVALSVDVPKDAGIPVAGDPDRLNQVLWNILSNAIKFTPAGGRVSVRLTRRGAYAEVLVSDTGVGLSADFLPRVFDRFRQADSSTTRVHGGLGLGLAIVRHLVDLHAGTVEAQSPGPGQGATFVVRLPLSSAREDAPAEGLAAGRGALAGRRILVVDDEADARELLAAVLVAQLAEVVVAGSAGEARDRIAENERFDAIVCDIGMPDEDGYAFLRELRGRGPARGGDVPAAALTAYVRIEDRRRALDAGFQLHVAKPVDPEELVAVVLRMVGGPAPAPA